MNIGNLLDAALEKPVPVTNETLAALVGVARTRGVEIISDDEREKITLHILPRWKNCHAAVNAHTAAAAKDAWLSHQQKMADKLAGGKPVSDAEDGWDRSDWESDYRAKMQAAKLGGTKVVEEAIALSKPCFERFAKFCEDFAIEQEAGEISVCENLKIEYAPSQIVRTIRSAPHAANVRLPSAAMWGHNPQTMVGWLLA